MVSLRRAGRGLAWALAVGLVGGCLLAPSPSVAVERERIGHIRPDTDIDARDDYFLRLLELALDSTVHDFGAYELVRAPVEMTQGRAIASMLEGRYVDVVWTMTNRTREATMRPVRVPLMRGLMGVRIPVVAADRVSGLDGVDDEATLAERVAGQGHDWPDVAVLRASGLPVDTASNYESVFRMLSHGRVDYVPRSVTEIWAERMLYRAHDLAVARRPLLVYHAPAYFFVAPDNLRLSLRLEVGLRRALEDGSLAQLFASHPTTRAAVALLEGYRGPVIRLHNPELPEFTPVGVPELWYSPVFGSGARLGD